MWRRGQCEPQLLCGLSLEYAGSRPKWSNLRYKTKWTTGLLPKLELYFLLSQATLRTSACYLKSYVLLNQLPCLLLVNRSLLQAFLATIFAAVLADHPQITCHKGGANHVHDCAHFMKDFCDDIAKHPVSERYWWHCRSPECSQTI